LKKNYKIRTNKVLIR